MIDDKNKLLAALLPLIPFDGWSQQSLKQASIDAGFDALYHQVLFPNGVIDAISFMVQHFDQEMLQKLKKQKLEKLRIRERIETAVRTRIECYQPIKPTISRTVTYLAWPTNTYLATTLLWQTADCIWQAAGDTSTDFNYYTKRFLLSSVYASTLLYWLKDDDEDHQLTWNFLHRRIENVLTIEKLKHTIRKNVHVG